MQGQPRTQRLSSQNRNVLCLPNRSVRFRASLRATSSCAARARVRPAGALALKFLGVAPGLRHARPTRAACARAVVWVPGTDRPPPSLRPGTRGSAGAENRTTPDWHRPCRRHHCGRTPGINPHEALARQKGWNVSSRCTPSVRSAPSTVAGSVPGAILGPQTMFAPSPRGVRGARHHAVSLFHTKPDDQRTSRNSLKRRANTCLMVASRARVSSQLCNSHLGL